jgi:putative endonuclease
LISNGLPAGHGVATLRDMGSVNQIIGGHGECLAARYAVAQGMAVIDRNWRCPTGELDMVLRDGRVLVFCEVKARRTLQYGDPVEAVVPAKVRRIRRLAVQWLESTHSPPRVVRFDVISIVYRGDVARVAHLRQAF